MSFSEFIKSPPGIAVVTALVVSFFLIVGLSRPTSVPIRTSNWENPPDVFICDVASVSEEQVVEAMKYWEDLGFEFGMVFSNWSCVYDDQEDYKHIRIPGTILIYPEYKLLGREQAGVARRSVDLETLKTHSAVIEIRVYKDRVIEHELGHALGWEHTNISGHIMHPQLSGGGRNSKGLDPNVELTPLDKK